MKTVYLVGIGVIMSMCTAAQTISIIPEPLSIQTRAGTFQLKPGDNIEVSSLDTGILNVANYFESKIAIATGFNLPVMQGLKSSKNGRIHFLLDVEKKFGAEGYEIVINADKIVATASQAAGLFYAAQSLLQLFPKQIESKTPVTGVRWEVPAVTIIDSPRFAWRGLMLDVTRHFFTLNEVKQFIDEMVRFKYNLLHLHLTDDQGWRLQIDSLPRLTEFGAWRPKREGKWGNTPPPDSTEPRNYGGFYTHDDIRDLVKYAADRYVNILPEIDVPGHSMAAVACYPELSCTPGNYHVNIGDKFMDWHGGGKFTALVDNTLCPTNENVYVFLDKVFTEVASLFPFKYIHMGGDEAAKNFWEQSDSIKALMASDTLANMEAVQSYFVKRVQQIIHSKGKTLMGWDEILEGGLPADASVMSWRGTKGGIAAAKAGHKVVMTPNDYVYVDLMQGDPIIEPKVYATVRLNQTYKFDPLPAGVDATMVLGGQGNLWTEQIPNMRAAQYMLWPRGLAIAESVWSPKEKKNWNTFIQKIENEFQRMDIRQVKYARSMYEPIFSVLKDGENIKVKLETEIQDIVIYYSFDETNPDEFYPRYIGVLSVPKDAATLKIITYRNGKPVGRQINMPVDELKKRVKK